MEASSAERVLTKPAHHFRVYDPARIREYWLTVEPLIERACEYSGGELTVPAVFDCVATEVWGLVGIEDEHGDPIAVAVLEIVRYPQERALWIKAAGGRDVDAWIKFDDHIDALARAAGCSRIKVQGRKGWQKKLPHWEWTHVILERKL